MIAAWVGVSFRREARIFSRHSGVFGLPFWAADMFALACSVWRRPRSLRVLASMTSGLKTCRDLASRSFALVSVESVLPRWASAIFARCSGGRARATSLIRVRIAADFGLPRAAADILRRVSSEGR